MQTELHSKYNGRDHYDNVYQRDGDQEYKWLQIGSFDKVDSIEQLLLSASIIPYHVVELGAGSGAVISGCKARSIGSKYTAIDYSISALNYLRKSDPSINILQADITSDSFVPPLQTDTLILTHVLEHLENPRQFLQQLNLKMQFNQIIIEVPLEDLPISRIKKLIKPRNRNLAGHVQFYNSKSFEKFIRNCGFKIVAKRVYIPVPSISTISFLMIKDKLPAWRFYYMVLVRIILPKLIEPVWKRVFYAHEALLCRPSGD